MRAIHPNLKVVLMSGYGGHEGLAGTLPELDAGWLEKPFSPRTLAETVRARLDG
jgi:hypothetical protein